MTDGADRSSGPDEPGTADAARPADDEPADDRSPESRLGTESDPDPLDELRRRQYTERQDRHREEEPRRREQEEREASERREQEQRQREQAEREARERRERERREQEQRRREQAEKEATPESAGGVSSTPSTPDASRRPRPSLPGDPRGPRRPGSGERDIGGDETRPLPSVESGMPRDRPPDPSRTRPSDLPQMRKPWERPAPAAFSSPGSQVQERAATRPEPPEQPETRPMPAPGPARPEGPEVPAKKETAAVAAAYDEAAIPRLERPPRQGPVRRRLTGLAAGSIFKLALVFYLGILITVVVGTSVLWLLLTATGVIENFESFLGELLGYEDFEFVFSRIIVVFVLVGLVGVVLSSLATALFAIIYNRATRFTGGLGVTVDDA